MLSAMTNVTLADFVLYYIEFAAAYVVVGKIF